MMHTMTTAASLPPLNADPVFDRCSENVDDAGGIRSDENGSDCPGDSVVQLELSVPLETSPVYTLEGGYKYKFGITK